MIKNEKDLDKIVKRLDEAVKSDTLVQYAQNHKIDKDKTLKKLSSEELSYKDNIKGFGKEAKSDVLV